MAVNNDNKRFSGQASFLGGVNSNLSPRLLGEDQVSWAVNASVRGGKIGPRPGFRKQTLVWGTASHETNFQDSTTKFQGAGVSLGSDGAGKIYCSVGGRIFLIEPEKNFKAADITPSGDPNSNTPSVVTFNQAERWMIIQDNSSSPLIAQGTNVRRAEPTEFRAGTLSKYVNGRLWTAKGFEYKAGDLVGSSSGSPSLAFKDAILKNTENTYLNGGGSFSVPVSAGPIQGMLPIYTLDTVLGQGELIVLTENAAFATAVPTDRSEWAATTYPLQRNVLSSGCVGPFSPVNVNNDIYFRSKDGIRSLLTARRDFQSPSNSPLSTEIERLLSNDVASLLPHTSSVVFDNRLLHTTNGNKLSRGVVHDAIAVMDFNPVSSLRGKAAPVWDGAWSGLKFLHLVEGTFDGEERAFAFTLNTTSDEIELWEITKDLSYDMNDAEALPIEWYFETRAIDLGSSFERKKLDKLELWLKEVEDDVDVKIYMRPDCSHEWNLWNNHTHDHQVVVCDTDADSFTDGCLDTPSNNSGYRARVSVANPPNDKEDETLPCKPKNFGYSFQFRVQMTGHASVDLIRWYADIESEPQNRPCPSTTVATTQDTSCPLDELPAIDLT